MSDELRELYQETILEHNKKPRNFRVIETADRKVEGFNPLCGDHYTVYITMDGERIADIAFQGSGCAISKSSASIMTTLLKGKTRTEADELFQTFHHMVTRPVGEAVDADSLGKIAIFSQICEFPARVKCASLAWHAMASAIKGEAERVTTE